VVLSDHAIDHIVLNTGFVDSMRHQARWSKSTRFSRPKGHLGTALTFSLPYALLGWVAALLLREPRLAFALLAWGIVDRMLIAAAIGGLVVEERPLWRSVLLYPVRDLMGFGFWLASYGSRRILWRGEQYVLERGGSMRPLHPHAAGRPAAERRPEPAERESALST
jgi:ceramide glucosyltransferase